MRMTLLLGALALGCNTATDDDTDPAGPGDDLVQSGDCDQDVTGWSTEGNHRSLSVQGDGFFLGSTAAHVIQSDEELASFKEDYDIAIEAVDFAEETILVAAVGASSTCGFSDEESSVHFYVPGEPDGVAKIHMSLSATDSSGTCDAVCDMSWSDIRAIAVSSPNLDPGPLEYSVCAQLLKTCAD